MLKDGQEMWMRRKLVFMLTVLCVIACTVICFVGVGKIQAEVQGDFEYRILGDGTVEIARYLEGDEVVTIPEQINGRKVTSIGDKAFKGHKYLESITIPSSVTNIGERAFDNCQYLEGITIPSGVTSIGEMAFEACMSLKRIAIPSGVTIIKNNTFENCYDLESVSIPTSVTSIEGNAFRECDSLTSIDIPVNVADIDSSAFDDCNNLEAINVNGSNTFYSSRDGILYNKGVTEIVLCPRGKSGKIIIPTGVTRINDCVFEGCEKLTGVTIPDGVVDIGISAFAHCASLTSVNLPDSLKTIGELAFCGCKGLTDVVIPTGVTSIGYMAFEGCSGITSIILPESLTNVEYRTFSYCENLQSLAIPNGVEEIWGFAFAGCASLTSVTIPESVKIINYTAFRFSRGIKTIDVDENNKYYASMDGILYNKDKTTLVICPEGRSGNLIIPEGVESLGDSSIEECKNIIGIAFPVSILRTGYYTFFECTGIKDVYYAGSKEQWEKIQMDDGVKGDPNGNQYILNANIHYNYNFSDIPLLPDEKPENPNTPSKPTEPTDPTDPTQPVTPSNPTTPTQPTNPGTSASTVTVSFDSQGGSEISDIRVERNGKLPYIPVTARSGYTFQGWYTGSNGTGSLLTLGTAIGENVTYYAYWTTAGRSMIGIAVFANGTPYIGSGIPSILTVRALYSDGTNEQVYDYSVSQSVLYSGSNTVTVTYRGYTQNITVWANAPGANASVRNLTVSYTGGAVPVGTYAAFGGLIVRAEYTDGTTQEVQGYTLSTHSVAKGNNRVTVMYGGKTADFYITGYQYSAVQMANVAGIPDILVSEQTKLSTVLQNFVPSKSGYYFSGWYLDEACTQKVTAGMDASAGTKVYAKWEKIYHWALNKTKASVKKGKKISLSVAGLSSSKITWKTSNSKIAKVSKQGVVKGIKKGTAMITAITNDGTVLTCTVQVKK